MTVLKITVEDKQADWLQKFLMEVSFVKNIEKESINETEEELAIDRIKKILSEAKGKNLFKDIKDPVEWQRELRKEWDRDF